MPETPTLETPPSSPSSAPPDRSPSGASSGTSATRLRSLKFGDLDHSDLVHLLESLDDDRSKARFRESIYISLFVWLALAWFAIYGPRFLFHQGKVVTPIGEQRNKNELTELDLPKSLVRTPRAAKVPAPVPAPDVATPEPPMARRPTPPPAPPQAAKPAPQQAQPTPAQPQAVARAQPPPPPPAAVATPQPTPRPPAIPDAPRPTQQVQGRPNFTTPGSAGQSIASATRDASRAGLGENGDLGTGARVGRGGAAAGAGATLLSDPMGVDFDPYLKRILAMIKAGWIPLIPEECNPPISKAGMTLIRLKIEKDGTITAHGMQLEDSTHDDAIDHAAWGGITSVGQFPPLPKAYPGTNIELRIQFNIIQRQQR